MEVNDEHGNPDNGQTTLFEREVFYLILDSVIGDAIVRLESVNVFLCYGRVMKLKLTGFKTNSSKTIHNRLQSLKSI